MNESPGARSSGLQVSEVITIKLDDSQSNQLEETEDTSHVIEQDSGIDKVMILWENWLIICIIYNFVTFSFFLGLPGFPRQVWTYLEFLSEVTLMIDVFIRYVLRRFLKNQKKTLNLLHEKTDDQPFNVTLYMASSLPTSIILYSSLNQVQLATIWVALVRGLKLYRIKQLNLYFDLSDIRERQESFIRTVQASLYILMVTHFLSCFWLFLPRVDSQQDLTWMNLVYSNYDVPNIQKYVDSVFFVVSSMTGLGFAYIYPRTDLEYAMQSLIMLLGVSLYANFFGFFAVSIYNRNRKRIENMVQFEESKKLAALRSFPRETKAQIRDYYNNLRMKYNALSENFQIMLQLPTSLRSEMSLYLSSDLIQKVNFFQFADPQLILKLSMCMYPELGLIDSYVVQQGEVATKLYFIQSGLVQVIATDNKTVIALMGEGTYFGEIGVLLTQKRSCSVRTRTVSVFFTVNKEDLLQVLGEFPLNLKYLKAVGRQRLKTTHPEDLVDMDDNTGMTLRLQQELEMMKKCKARSSNLFGLDSPQNIQLKSHHDLDANDLEAYEEIYQPKIKWYQTDVFRHLSDFVIIPFSLLFNVWSSIFALAFLFNILFVPFAIGLSYEITGYYIIIDVAVVLVTIADSFLRPFLATNENYEIETERSTLLRNYVQRHFLLDVLSSIPFDYLLLLIEDSSIVIRYFRLLRLLKVYRMNELVILIRQHTTVNVPILRIWILAILMIIIAHWFNCIMLLFAKWEIGQNRRFDGNSLLQNLVNSSSSRLPAIEDWTPWEYYFNLYILNICFMGSIMYGDIIPFTISEETLSIFYMIVGRAFIAFLFAEVSSYVKHQYSAYDDHKRQETIVMKWMQIHGMNDDIKVRAKRYFDQKWQYQKGVQEIRLISELPKSLQMDVNNFIFDELIQNCDVFPRENKGAILTITTKLKRKLYPKGEYIIKQGELAQEMFFIMKGEVGIVTTSGVTIASLTKNMHFGEMALLQEEISVRSSSAIASTNLVLAVLTVKDFKLICENYPEFQHRMQEIFDKRAKESKLKGVTISSNHARRPSARIDFKQHFKSKKLSPKIGKSFEDKLYSKNKIIPFYPGKSVTLNRELSMIEEDRCESNINISNASFNDDGDFQSRRKGSTILKKKSCLKMQSEENNSEEVEIKIHEHRIGLPQNLDQYEPSEESHSSFQSSPYESNDGYQINVTRNINDQESFSSRLKNSNTGEAEIQNATMVLKLKQIGSQNLDYTPSLESHEDDPPFDTKREATQTLQDLLSSKEKIDIPQQVKHPGKLTRLLTRTSTSMSQLEEYLAQFRTHHQPLKTSFMQMFLFYAFKYLLIFPLTIYNLVFIPLQMAFNYEFTSWYLFFEILTILAYLADIFLIGRNLVLLKKDNSTLKTPSESQEFTLHVVQDRDEIQIKMKQVQIDLTLSVLSMFPFSLILSQTTTYLFIVNGLRALRMIKLLPLYRVCNFLKKFGVNKVRLMEIILAYYVIAHLLAGVMLSLGLAQKPDISNTWLNKVPVPLPAGVSKISSVDDVDNGTLYIHAIYFAANTISHVAIGDLTSVSTDERVINSFIIVCITLFYALLFANISSIFNDENNFLNFHQRYQTVLQKIPREKMTSQIMNKINTYYEYLWSVSQGFDEEKDVLRKLPPQIMYEAFRERYSEAFENSLLFKTRQGVLDCALMNSVIELIQIQVFMPREFIIKAGSLGDSLYMILDGEAVMIGLGNDIISVLRSGSHYDMDIGNGKLSEDTHYGKRIFHLVSQSQTTIAILDNQSQVKIFSAFPLWKQLIQDLNNQTHTKIKDSLEFYLAPIVRLDPYCNEFKIELETLQKHLTESSKTVYQKVLNSLDDPKNSFLYDHKSMRYKNHDTLLKQRLFLEKDGFVDENSPQSRKAMSLGNLPQRMVRRANSSSTIKFIQLATLRKQKSIEEKDMPSERKTCKPVLKKLYCNRISRTRTFIDFIHMLNLIYIAVAVPLTVAFAKNLDKSTFIAFESTSIFLQMIVVFVHFRTPIFYYGGTTMEFKHLFKHYLLNGMIPDLFGVLPLNLVFGYYIMDSNSVTWISLFRITRMIALLRLMELFEKFQIYLKTYSIFMVILKALMFLLLLWHWTSCVWFFINQLEYNSYPVTWLKKFNVQARPTSEQYLLSMYYAIKIVTGVGQSDMIAYNNLERIIFMLIINVGDALFAFAFGLIAQVQMHVFENSSFQHYLQEMKTIELFLRNIKAEDDQRKRVESYFSYNYHTQNQQHLVQVSDLEGYLPTSLINEVVYEAQKDILQSVFKDFKSENFMRDLASVLRNTIYMPDDYIIQKGQEADEMFFIVSGKVQVLAGDKSTVLATLTKGSCFGEIGIFMRIKRIAFVQAKTFCIVSTLKKSDLEKIILSYPSLALQFVKKSEQRMLDSIKIEEKRFRQFSNEKEDSIEQSFMNAIETDGMFGSQEQDTNQPFSLLSQLKNQQVDNPIIDQFILNRNLVTGQRNSKESLLNGTIGEKPLLIQQPKKSNYSQLNNLLPGQRDIKNRHESDSFHLQCENGLEDSSDSSDTSNEREQQNNNPLPQLRFNFHPTSQTSKKCKQSNQEELIEESSSSEGSRASMREESKAISILVEEQVPPLTLQEDIQKDREFRSPRDIEEVKQVFQRNEQRKFEMSPLANEPVGQSVIRSKSIKESSLILGGLRNSDSNMILNRIARRLTVQNEEMNCSKTELRKRSEHIIIQQTEATVVRPSLTDSITNHAPPKNKSDAGRRSVMLFKQAMGKMQDEEEASPQIAQPLHASSPSSSSPTNMVQFGKSTTIRTQAKKHGLQRRLSKLQLGKNLMLSKTSGLKLQWTVGQ